MREATQESVQLGRFDGAVHGDETADGAEEGLLGHGEYGTQAGVVEGEGLGGGEVGGEGVGGGVGGGRGWCASDLFPWFWGVVGF